MISLHLPPIHWFIELCTYDEKHMYTVTLLSLYAKPGWVLGIFVDFLLWYGKSVVNRGSSKGADSFSYFFHSFQQ